MFGRGFDQFFMALLNSSLTAAVVVALLLPVRLLLKRAPRRVVFLLWAPVLVRLLCPVRPQSPLSLLPVQGRPLAVEMLTAAEPAVQTGIVPLDRMLSSALPAGQPAASVNPLQLWFFAAQGLWLVGLAVGLGYIAFSLLQLRRLLCGAAPLEPGVYQVGGLSAPFLFGLFRPRVYLPAGLSAEERRYVLLHERAHLRRGDHLVRLAAFAALLLHWFNPLVWLAFILSGRDMEMACDEQVVARLGEGARQPYSALLLELTAGRGRCGGGLPLALGPGALGARIRHILAFRRLPRWAVGLLGAAVLVACLGLALDPSPAVTTAGAVGAGGGARPVSTVAPARVESSEPLTGPMGEVELLRALRATVSVTGEGISWWIPAEAEGENTLEIEASLLIPREENGTPYTERQELETQRWGPGSGYAGQAQSVSFGPGVLPDGTVLSFSSRFLTPADPEGGSIVTCWDNLQFTFAGGQPVEEGSPVLTRVEADPQPGEGNRFRLRYTESNGGGFAALLTLPQGWTLQPQAGGGAGSCGFAPVALFRPGANGPEEAGSLCYNAYTVPLWESADLHVPIYSSLMLGSVVNWNQDYQEVARSGQMVAATCRILQGGSEEPAGAGVLARNDFLGRYIAIQLPPDALSQGELEALAASIELAAE